MRELLNQIADRSSPERDEVLARLRADDPSVPRPRVPDARGDISEAPATSWPATPVQEQLWLIERLRGTDHAYTVPFLFEVRGPADTERLRDATNQVLARHEGLGTRFREVDGRLHQERVTERGPACPPAERVTEDAAASLVEELATSPFDLASGPLCALRLLRISPTCHRLVLVAHHGVTDGWSTGVLLQEIARAYRGDSLPSLDITWSRYAEESATTRDVPRIAEAVRHWVTELQGLELEATGVPIDHPGTQLPTMRAGTVRFALPQDAGTPEAAAARLNVSEFVLYFAAFQHAIGEVTGASTIVTGVPLLNRARPGTANLVGPLSNTLPIRVDLGDAPAETLAASATAVRNGLAAQEAPVPLVVQGLPGMMRAGAANPLFRQLFNMGNLPGSDGTVRLDEATSIHAVGVPNGTARVGLELTLEETGNVVRGRLEFDRSLHLPITAARVLNAFTRCLRELCRTGPERRPTR